MINEDVVNALARVAVRSIKSWISHTVYEHDREDGISRVGGYRRKLNWYLEDLAEVERTFERFERRKQREYNRKQMRKLAVVVPIKSGEASAA